jgi:hypothetical protein
MLSARDVMLVLGLAAAQAVPAVKWTTVAPEDVGFSVQAPGTPRPNPEKPTKYSVILEDSSFIVDVDALEVNIRQAVASGDKNLIARYMETLRDVTVDEMKATRRTNSSADYNGNPSLFFTFDGALGDLKFEGTERIVLANDRLYLVVAIGTAGKLPKADVDRFHGSFRLTKAPPPALPTTTSPAAPAAGAPSAGPPAAEGYKFMSYEDALCSKQPPVALNFEVPVDFVARAPTPGIESGCLLGTKGDVDRAINNPSDGLTDLSRGVFHLRVSTEVINDPRTGIFDGMDGSGEEGLRRQIVSMGGKLIVWKKEILGGLPALQVVGDLGADRAYMLYLGNTRFNSNAILISFHPPRKRAADDDQAWARFVAGIRANP